MPGTNFRTRAGHYGPGIKAMPVVGPAFQPDRSGWKAEPTATFQATISRWDRTGGGSRGGAGVVVALEALVFADLLVQGVAVDAELLRRRHLHPVAPRQHLLDQ